jgi:predicted lipoprotein with Yx(FWY)xxD motif
MSGKKDKGVKTMMNRTMLGAVAAVGIFATSLAAQAAGMLTGSNGMTLYVFD